MSDWFASFWICAFVSILFWLNFDGENVRPNCFCDAHSSKNDIQFSIETIFNYIFVLNFFFVSNQFEFDCYTYRTNMRHVNENTSDGMRFWLWNSYWNRTWIRKMKFYFKQKKKEKNTLVENVNKWFFFYQRLITSMRTKERTY